MFSPKGEEQAVPFVRTGLIAEQPSVPYVVIPPNGPKWYFSATAVNEEGLESDYSEEVSYRLTTGPQAGVTLSWDRGEPSSANETYKVYRGKQSRAYTDTFKAGTNLTLTISPSPSKTNRIVTVTTQNATNLAYASKLGVRWTFIGATNWTATNPASMRFWRAVGTKNSSSKVEIGVSYR